MKLEALPAKKGDCLLLHYGSDEDPRLVVIDGGPSGVYKKSLLSRLEALRDERVASGVIRDDDPLMIDLVIVSHIDDDHINGIKALLTDMRQRQVDNDAPAFRIGRLWHNGFDSLASVETGDINAHPVLPPIASVTASMGGSIDDTDDDGQNPARHDFAKVLASVEQGHDVIKLAKALGIPINPEFGGKAIVAGSSLSLDDLKVTVIGPLQAELDKLRADFKKWLAKRAEGTGAPASLVASFDDDSVANLSSIVLLVEDGTERYLLTGDARGDFILTGIEQLGLAGAGEPFPLDILKVQHHGSDRNSTTGFFERLPAKRYIFSGNGEHGNPERKTFGYLAKARANTSVEVELTYTPAEIDAGRAAEWAKHHKTGPAFDHAKDGVVSFLAAHPGLVVKHP